MSSASGNTRANRVFVNCPFDDEFKPIFDAIVFAVHACGFEARHALLNEGEAIRLTRIVNEIQGSGYSIHDLSRVQVGRGNKLPRFNMPFEAGIAYGESVSRQDAAHHVLFLEAKRYRHAVSTSDLAGLDPKIHENDPRKAMGCVRNFLQDKSSVALPGGDHLWAKYELFRAKLDDLATSGALSVDELSGFDGMRDLQLLMSKWIVANLADASKPAAA